VRIPDSNVGIIATKTCTMRLQTKIKETMMIDYAHPLIVLDDLLKEIHQLCIDKRYEEAVFLAREAMYELSVLQCNLSIMASKNV
jgi:hypothetical protein